MQEFSFSFRAMDTDVDIVVEAESHPMDRFLSARLLFERSEEKFSRFRPSSLLSALNLGRQIDDAEFAKACGLALEAFETTGGAFNPLVLTALEEAGYDRSFEQVSGGSLVGQAVPDPRGCLSIRGDVVELTCGRADLGGLIKGWTVDRCFELLYGHLDSVLVNAGGDLRCEPAGGEGWEMEVEGPDGSVIWKGRISGAMATSSKTRRSWKTAANEPAHHLIDPATGLPSQSDWQQVTARGALAWRAEVWAKAVLIAGQALAPAAVADGYALLAVSTTGAIEHFAWAD